VSTKTTKIVSFRVPVELADKLDREAESVGKDRSEWLRDIFIPSLQSTLNTAPKNNFTETENKC
jgi:predicted DNA-binding protein